MGPHPETKLALLPHLGCLAAFVGRRDTADVLLPSLLTFFNSQSWQVGRLRAGGPASGTVTETGLTSKGVRLNHNSLRCATGATPVCLVRGPYDGGMAGEVHVWRGDSWATVDRFFFSDGGVVMLDDVVDTALPEVILAREVCVDKTRRGNRLGSCSNVGVLAEVVDLEGDRAGCTVPRTSPGELPGWPEVQVRRDDLTECPDDLEAG